MKEEKEISKGKFNFKKFIIGIKDLTKNNIRQYGMMIALVLIAIVFGIITSGNLFSPQNINNLIYQNSYVIVLAVGMMIVTITGNTDLSIGSAAAITSALCGIFIMRLNLNPILSIFLILIISVLIGMWNGYWIAYRKIPAFIVTLSGMMVFRGIAQALLKAESIGLTNEGFKNIFVGHLEDIKDANAMKNFLIIVGIIAILFLIYTFKNKIIENIKTSDKRRRLLTIGVVIGGLILSSVTIYLFSNLVSKPFSSMVKNFKFNVLSVIIGIISSILVIIYYLAKEKTKQKYNLKRSSTKILISKIGIISIVINTVTLLLALYNGILKVMVIMIVVVFIYSFIMQKTVLGRHIYATGGNQEAAKLSGINTKRTLFIVFTNMGFLAGIGGILAASRLGSSTPNAGNLFELDAIAAAFIGGTSASGGIGTIFGALIGALVMGLINNGMNLISIEVYWQHVVKGAVLLLAVWFDISTKNKAK